MGAAEIVLGLISTWLRELNHLGLWQWGEGSWRLRPLEVAIIKQAIAIMPAHLQPKAEAQLQQRMFVERSNPRINVIGPYRHERALNLEGEWKDALVKVAIRVDGKKQTANVTTIDGRLFSVEFMKSAKFYKQKTVLIDGAKLGSPRQSFTRTIDRLEHGRSKP